MFEQEQRNLETEINAFLQTQGVLAPDEFKWSPIPFSGEWGISTSFFQIAADEARSGKKVIVPQRAQELAEGAKEHLGIPAGYSHIEAVKGYLNLYFQTSEFSRRVVDTALAQGQRFGSSPDTGKTVMVEFSQPNTHKALHVGHLRTMMLGASIANILEFAGYNVVRANYIGDFGRDVIKWMWNFHKLHSGEQPPDTDVTKWMGDLYAESTANLENDPDGEKEILEMFAKWEARDPEIYSLWQTTRQWSLDGFNEIYDQLDIHFDRFYYESDMEAPGKVEVENLLKKGIAVDERAEGGPVLVKIDEQLGLDKETYRVLVLMRSDGTSLYGAWDLSLAQQKFADYDLDLSVYVVDVRQSLHFQQVFKILELAGWEDIDKVHHLAYEIVNLPGNVTMSSREGTVVLLEDLIREAIQRAYEVSQERNPELDDITRKGVADAVGIGAIKYPLLARDNTKIAVFDWETALDFNGRAAPYIQYAFVRCNSLLKRMEGEIPGSTAPNHELNEKEIALIEAISQFPGIVQRAAQEYKTLHIANAAYDLASSFNEFYNTTPVLKAEPETMAFRLRLVAAAQQAISSSLKLLGIETPDVM